MSNVSVNLKQHKLFRVDAKSDEEVKAATLTLLKLIRQRTGNTGLDKHIKRLGGVL